MEPSETFTGFADPQSPATGGTAVGGLLRRAAIRPERVDGAWLACGGRGEQEDPRGEDAGDGARAGAGAGLAAWRRFRL